MRKTIKLSLIITKWSVLLFALINGLKKANIVKMLISMIKTFLFLKRNLESIILM